MALFSECMLSCARKCLTPPTLLETPDYVNNGSHLPRDAREKPFGLSPFPKNPNRHVDHDHDYYDLNQEPNRHFTTSLTPPN